MPRSERKAGWRLGGAALAVALTLGLGACGGGASQQAAPTTTEHGSAGPGQTAAKSISPITIPTTTTQPAPPQTPTYLDREACRLFTSFKDVLAGSSAFVPSATAVGEVGGMLEQAQPAASKAGGGAPAKLASDLQALESLTKSKAWTGKKAEVAAPQVQAVAADCAPLAPS